MVQNINFHEDSFNSILKQFEEGDTATILAPSLKGFHLGDTLRIFEIKNGYDITNRAHRIAVSEGKMKQYTGRELRCFVKACFIPDNDKGYGVVLKKED